MPKHHKWVECLYRDDEVVGWVCVACEVPHITTLEIQQAALATKEDQDERLRS